jgi:hypothetical protein
MDMIPLKTERKAPLEEYAKRRGQDPPAAALDNALAAYLECEGQDFAEAAEGIRRGHEDMSDDKTRPAGEFLADLRRKHDIPRRTTAEAERDAHAILEWLLSQHAGNAGLQ